MSNPAFNINESEMLLDALNEKVSATVHVHDKNDSKVMSIANAKIKVDRRRRAVRKTKKFEPVTWKPLYDALILEYVMFGGKKKELAEKFKVTPQTVSNVINCEQGRQLIRSAQERVREKMLRTIPQRMGDVAEKFVDRMEQFAKDDSLYEKSPFAVIDRGMKYLQGTALLKSESSPTNINNNISEKAVDRLANALERIGASVNPPMLSSGDK